MAANTPTKKTALKPCECSLWEFDLDVDRDDDYSTGCQAMTVRTFAQGHDAKLVGFMVRADIAGHEISKREGGMLVSYAGATHAAGTISDALALKASIQLEAQRARAAKKASKPARKATPAPAPAPLLPIEARIKVGRWTYDAKIDRDTQAATYTTKLGATKTAKLGEYSQV